MRDRLAKIVSGVGPSTHHRHVEDGVEKGGRHHSAHGIHASDGIGAALAGGAATGLGLGIALGTGDSPEPKQPKGGYTLEDPSQPEQTGTPWSDSVSELRVVVDSPMRASPSDELTMNVDANERGILADAHSFTSSPRSGAMPLQSPTSQHSNRVHFPAFFPGLYARLERLMLRERSTSKEIKWLSDSLKDLVIGRNSEFYIEELTDEQLEELGGIEYRALRLLSYIVILQYFIGTQMISFILIAPWLSTTHTYDGVFASQPRLVNKSWFTVFQIVGAYTGGGMSLVDAGMVPFQTAYLMIFAMIFVILAGNHGMVSAPLVCVTAFVDHYDLFPSRRIAHILHSHADTQVYVDNRWISWVYTKFVKPNTPKDAALDFLLDHPRRCFLYLFPSHVTWYLTATLITFTIIELVCFIVLDIGLQVTDSLSPGTRVVAGLFQSFAVRASGFSIVSIASLAPSFQFLCVIMMYIAIYPVALSIRSTNVYEEKSLGVFEASPEDEDEEPNLDERQPRHERIGKYFSWHLRRQLAFDIWWLVFAIFAVCIIERTKIMDDENAPWFNVFRIVFELVSAFGGIGLTLGIPTQNYSFSGAFGPVSKIVVIIIMVRGRHRGLPVAIDRAILLPEDLKPNKNGPQADQNGVVPAVGPQVVNTSEKEMSHAA
ncbi:hypothetical protein BN946_scf184829.g55 [Trametes cinnabarina]|uniref:Cation transporter n=1 Tax=Pycnoporus cinnabarinus TaxID=5643 RepID=A0A060S9Q0_PYCCI|nr:hypothetical protein BN946_scf184829.g55 [Trametes cinnabarina]